ncbi:MAG TPA: ABC transporter ATP-binding protein [Solirubrobacteraceae bacterium]|nr:ABC transporter ATP-binding protein [Solirubrobacteraceae bacterium]
MSAVLGVSALGKRYGELEALRDVSFDAGAGELIAIVGPNGAGKTTLLSIIVGIQAPSAGVVSRAGDTGPAGGMGGTGATRDIGWVPQSPALYARLSVAENLELFARLERVADPRATVEQMLEQTGLRERAGEPAGRLSGGNRQRVNVAIGLLGEPSVLALDEPSASLDPGQRERLWRFVSARVAAGTTVLFSTHNVGEAQRHATRVLVLARGQLLFDGTPQALLRDGGEPDGGDLERALVRFLDERTSAPHAA